MNSINRTYGISFPFLESKSGRYLHLNDKVRDEIRSNLIHLIITRRGSRYFLPTFGTRIYEFIFEQMDSATYDLIEADITEAVNEFIPNLQINQITITPLNEIESENNLITNPEDRLSRVSSDETKNHTVRLKIDYTIKATTFNTKDFVIINI